MWTYRIASQLDLYTAVGNRFRFAQEGNYSHLLMVLGDFLQSLQTNTIQYPKIRHDIHLCSSSSNPVVSQSTSQNLRISCQRDLTKVLTIITDNSYLVLLPLKEPPKVSSILRVQCKRTFLLSRFKIIYLNVSRRREKHFKQHFT